MDFEAWRWLEWVCIVFDVEVVPLCLVQFVTGAFWEYGAVWIVDWVEVDWRCAPWSVEALMAKVIGSFAEIA